MELLPALAAREPTSGYLFYDCQTDDVRLGADRAQARPSALARCAPIAWTAWV